MDELKSILEAVGVLSWLRDRFPGLSDQELIANVDNDFVGMLEALGNGET